jgi:nucleoside-triphosphate--adenylate kinase
MKKAVIEKWTTSCCRSISSSNSDRLKNVVILGAPGGGKGTISKYLLRDFPLRHISTGDILRQHISMQTPLGKSAESIVKAGGLVPDALIFDAMDQQIEAMSSSDSQISLLFDGFPRTLPQAEMLQRKHAISAVISLEIPHETVIDRMSKRWVHLPSGRTYSYDFNPPRVKGIDDETGDALVQREDDKPETVRRRLEAYDSMKNPILKYYDNLPAVRTERFHGTESKAIYPKVKLFLKQELGLQETDILKLS